MGGAEVEVGRGCTVERRVVLIKSSHHRSHCLYSRVTISVSDEALR